MNKNKKRTLLIKHLIKYRIDNDLSIKDMADKLGISKEVYRYYENGSRNPKIKVLEKIDSICLFNNDKSFIQDYKSAVKRFSVSALNKISYEKIEDDDLLDIYNIIKKYR